MSITIRILLVLVSVLTFFWLMHRIRKEKLLISDAVFWILFSAGLLLLSIFPQVIIWAAGLLGFYSPVNLILILIIFILLLKMFTLSLHISHTDCKLRQTVQEMALLEKRLREAENKCSVPIEDSEETGEKLQFVTV